MDSILIVLSPFLLLVVWLLLSMIDDIKIPKPKKMNNNLKNCLLVSFCSAFVSLAAFAASECNNPTASVAVFTSIVFGGVGVLALFSLINVDKS